MAQAAVTERHVRTGSTMASTISEASLPVDGLVRRLGFWSAVAAGVFSIAFAIGTIVGVLLFPPTLWTGDITAFAAKYNPIPMALAVGPSFLIAPAFLGLAVAIHSGARAQRRPLTLLGLLFATIYVTTVGINYFLQLTVVRQNLMAGTTDGIGLFALINFQSVASALEFLGYFWQGVAALFMAAYFVGPGIGRWTRWMLIAVFASGALGVVAAVRGTTFSDPLFIGGGAVWTLCFPAAMILAALYFRHIRVASHASSNRDVINVPAGTV